MPAAVSQNSRPDPLEDERVSEARAAEIIGLPLKSLQRRRRTGKGPRYLRISPNTVVYNLSDLRTYLLDAMQEGQAS